MSLDLINLVITVYLEVFPDFPLCLAYTPIIALLESFKAKLSRSSLKDLKALAKSRNIARYYRLSKKDLIAAIA